ncbi:hypothetical protein DPEC_G00111740 [Dallia pectoralis]|uniref:Uncharacterized protein n=1 Tax=Dallia pectoralis TaxID=75939 RepID=A0ACC2GTD8_DALPE|nr:hypothetical protein DPEC_G00111740 [Dallia pectoralis]
MDCECRMRTLAFTFPSCPVPLHTISTDSQLRTSTTSPLCFPTEQRQDLPLPTSKLQTPPNSAPRAPVSWPLPVYRSFNFMCFSSTEYLKESSRQQGPVVSSPACLKIDASAAACPSG